jgi:hypothetical protein
VLPTDGLICVAYSAVWKESVNAAARAAIFVGSNQLKRPVFTASSAPQEAKLFVITTDLYKPLFTSPTGLEWDTIRTITNESGNLNTVPTTGQVVGGGSNDDKILAGGPCYIFAAAGTYDISVQFKASSGSVTAMTRKLWVWTQAF